MLKIYGLCSRERVEVFMKKKLLLIFFIILLLIGVVVIILTANKSGDKTSDIGNFNIADYSQKIDKFTSEKVLGAVDSKENAIEKAANVWLEIYGESVKDKKPYIASFDKKSHTWLVQGTLAENWLGGVPHILIRESDGKVLAVWHDK